MNVTTENMLDPNSYLGNAFLTTLGLGPDAQRVVEAFHAAGDAGVDMVFEVAGVRFDASVFFERFQAEMEAIIAKAAHSLVTEKLGAGMSEVSQLHEDLVRRSRELFGVYKQEWE